MKGLKYAWLILPVLVLAAIVCVGELSEPVQAAADSMYTYYTYNDKATITDCDTAISGNVVIPSKLGGYPVTAISYKAFENCTALTAVTVPDSVTTIERHAFQACTGLTSVTIGSGVTSIGSYPFDGCSGIEEILVSNNNSSYSNDSYGVLFNKNKTTLIYAPAKLSGSYAIPQGVQEIGDTAFRECLDLKAVTIPEGVVSIGEFAFHRCKGITSLTMPDSITQIGSSAFHQCSELKSVKLSANLSVIGFSAFSRTGLTSIVIPDQVKVIEGSTFAFCSSLKKIVLPKGLERIGFYAFHDSLNIETIYYKGTQEQWRAVKIEDHTYTVDPHNDWYWVPITYEFAGGIPGDVDGDIEINDADAMYLLRYTLFGATRYPLSAEADVNSDGTVNDADAMYLLRYTLFPERYPLYPTVS